LYIVNKKVDPYQEKAILCQENCLLIAGAGAGKTFTILGKITYLIENNIYREKEILVISFTNKSVSDLQNKIKYQIDIFTFHKLAMTILKDHNISFKIAPSSLLEYITDEFFQSLQDEKLKQSILKIFKEYDYRSFLKSQKYRNLSKIIITYIRLYKTTDSTKNELSKSFNLNPLLTKLIIIIMTIYENELKSTSLLDFDDLIKKATETLTKTYKYKLIIIDEFQDTSLLRWHLIEKIIKLNNAKIFAVGDDFQSIYHFTGCTIDLFLDFQKLLPNAKVLKLKYTYRNSQELIDIAGKFITKNPHQVPKELKSHLSIDKPIKYQKYLNPSKSLSKLLNKLIYQYKDILILGRNNKDIEVFLSSQMSFDKNNIIYQNHQIRYLTVHSSKGLEADVTILINITNSPTGFPSQIKESKLLNHLNSSKDNYLYAEERRLFYVALTRTKNEAYLMIPLFHPSIFVKELKKITH